MKIELPFCNAMLEEAIHYAQQRPVPEPNMEYRDIRGRFAKGNKGGPGNPHYRRIAGYRKAVAEAVSDEDLAAIMKAMVAKAKEGDVAAAKVVLQYTVGKPAAAADPDRADVEEWKLTEEKGVSVEAATAAAKKLPVAEALKGTDNIRELYKKGNLNAVMHNIVTTTELDHNIRFETDCRIRDKDDPKPDDLPDWPDWPDHPPAPKANGVNGTGGQATPNANGDNGASRGEVSHRAADGEWDMGKRRSFSIGH